MCKVCEVFLVALLRFVVHERRWAVYELRLQGSLGAYVRSGRVKQGRIQSQCRTSLRHPILATSNHPIISYQTGRVLVQLTTINLRLLLRIIRSQCLYRILLFGFREDYDVTFLHSPLDSIGA